MRNDSERNAAECEYHDSSRRDYVWLRSASNQIFLSWLLEERSDVSVEIAVTQCNFASYLATQLNALRFGLLDMVARTESSRRRRAQAELTPLTESDLVVPCLVFNSL
jgi:hypothetical protein